MDAGVCADFLDLSTMATKPYLTVEVPSKPRQVQCLHKYTELYNYN